MTPGNKPHPIDRVLHDKDTVQLGGVTLTALLTPGHTKGCSTYTMKAQDAGSSASISRRSLERTILSAEEKQFSLYHLD